MKELDKRIREALKGEDAEWMKQLDAEPSMFELVLETFQGRSRWIAFLFIFWSFIFLGLSIFAIVRFLDSTDTHDMILWAGAGILFLSGVSMMKLWYWMEMNKNSITREIKRLELQVARLANRIKE